MRIRELTAMRSTGVMRSLAAAPFGGSVSVIRAASATVRQTAKVASSPARSVAALPRPDRSWRPMDAISAWSARSRTASPALMPAAVRSSWARSSCSIQRSTADSSRYC